MASLPTGMMRSGRQISSSRSSHGAQLSISSSRRHAIAALRILAGEAAAHRRHVDVVAEGLLVDAERAEPLEQVAPGRPGERLAHDRLFVARRLPDEQHRRRPPGGPSPPACPSAGSACTASSATCASIERQPFGALHAGSCCVMQCSVPSPHTRSTQCMPTTSRPRNSSPRMPSARAIGRIVERRHQHHVVGDVEVGVARRQPPPVERQRARHRQRARPRACARARRARPRSRSRFSRERAIVLVAAVGLLAQHDHAPGATKRARSSMWPCVSSPAMPRPSHTHALGAELRAQDAPRARRVDSPGLRACTVVLQALLGGQQRALAVDVDGAALEHHVRARAPRRVPPRRSAARAIGRRHRDVELPVVVLGPAR